MKVVLLLGPSSAGKTTLCKELATREWRVVSFDEVVTTLGPKMDELAVNEMERQNLFKDLDGIMTVDDVKKLFFTGVQCNITKGPHTLSYQFDDPSLPNIEEVLEKAGFDKHKIPDLAAKIRHVPKVCEAFRYPSALPFTIDEAFEKSVLPDESVIIDLVPLSDYNPKQVLDYFEQRAQQFRDQNLSINLTTHTVLAFSPPDKLSERIKSRNSTAIERGDHRETRIGLFPFAQLSDIVSANENNDVKIDAHLSKDELFKLVSEHRDNLRSPDTNSPLVLENPFDPSAVDSTEEIVPSIKTTDSKITLDDKDGSSITPSKDKPRIGSQIMVNEFSMLTKKFGLFGNQEERVPLQIRKDLKFDVVINTSTGNPHDLADELLNKLGAAKSKPSLS